MDEFLCLCDWVIVHENKEHGKYVEDDISFCEGESYEGYIDDEGGLRLVDEQGNEICISDGEWQECFEEA